MIMMHHLNGSNVLTFELVKTLQCYGTVWVSSEALEICTDKPTVLNVFAQIKICDA